VRERVRPTDPDWYRERGYLVIKGQLGEVPVTIVISPYVQERMQERDVIQDEVLDLLARPLSSHKRGSRADRREVIAPAGRRTLKAVYERFSSDWVVLITVHQV
jgi:hypothetical protein